MHSRALSLWFIGINHRIHILPDTTASPRSDEKRTGGNLNVSEEKHCQCSANWQADASQASAAPVIFFGSRGNPAEKPEHAEAEAEAASLVHTGAVCVRTSTQDSAVTVARRDWEQARAEPPRQTGEKWRWVPVPVAVPVPVPVPVWWGRAGAAGDEISVRISEGRRAAKGHSPGCLFPPCSLVHLQSSDHYMLRGNLAPPLISSSALFVLSYSSLSI